MESKEDSIVNKSDWHQSKTIGYALALPIIIVDMKIDTFLHLGMSFSG